MLNIFISYRREDSLLFTGRLSDRLLNQYGPNSVFIDLDTIPFGVDFRNSINEALGHCHVALVVIGNNWLGTQSDGNRRIDDPRDFVRMEVEMALKLGVPVIPVLINNAEIPREGELPQELHPLIYRNGCAIDSGRDFHLHLNRLTKHLDSLGVRSCNALIVKERMQLFPLGNLHRPSYGQSHSYLSYGDSRMF